MRSHNFAERKFKGFESGKIRYKKSCQRYTKRDQDGVYDLPQNILVVAAHAQQNVTSKNPPPPPPHEPGLSQI